MVLRALVQTKYLIQEILWWICSFGVCELRLTDSHCGMGMMIPTSQTEMTYSRMWQTLSLTKLQSRSSEHYSQPGKASALAYENFRLQAVNILSSPKQVDLKLHFLAQAAIAKCHEPDSLDSRNLFLKILEAECPRSDCQLIGFLMKYFFLACRRLVLTLWRESSGFFLLF